MMLLLAATPETAQAIVDRLQARLASATWVEFTNDSLLETNFWTEYRVERPHAVASTHHTVFSIYKSDGVRTTGSGARNRPALPGDLRVPPGWEALVGRRTAPSGDARETPQGVDIDLAANAQHYVLHLDRSSGLPSGYRIVAPNSVSGDLIDFHYGNVRIHRKPPANPIHVAVPKPIDEIVRPLAAWLHRQTTLRLRLTHDVANGTGHESITLQKGAITVHGKRVPGFESFFGVKAVRAQGIGIGWLDASSEAYLARTYTGKGWTDVYYATETTDHIHFPVGYVRVVDGQETERVAIEIEG